MLKRIIIIVLVVGPAILFGVPYWFGSRAEVLFQESLEYYAESGRIRLHDSTFDRGWLQSRAQTDFELGDSGLRVRAQHQILHGPFPPAKLTTTLLRLRPVGVLLETEAELSFSSGPPDWQVPLTATTTAPVAGPAHTRFAVPAGERTLQASRQLEWQALQGELSFSPFGDELAGGLESDQVTVAQPGSQISAGPCRSSFASQRGDSGLLLGQSQVICETVSLHSPPQSQPQLTLRQLEFTSDANEQAGSIGYDLSARFSALEAAETRLGAGQWSLAVRDLDGESLLAMQAPSASSSLRQLISAVVRRNASLASELSVSSADGPLTAEFGVRLADSAVGDNPFALLATLEAHLKLLAPPPIVERIATLAVRRDLSSLSARGNLPRLSAAQRTEVIGRAAGERIEEWRQRKLLVQEGDRYALTASFRAGTLRVNGQVMDWTSLLR